MLETYTIILGIGVGKICFGMSMEAVIQQMGYNYTKSQDDWTDGSLEIQLNYASQKIQFSSSSENELRLTKITLRSKKHNIKQQQIIGKTITETKQSIQTVHTEKPTYELVLAASSENHKLEVLWYEDHSFSIWFKDDTAYEIVFSPFWKDDENYLFP